MATIEIIDNRGDNLKHQIKRSEIVQKSLTLVARRNNEGYCVARVAMGFRVDPTYTNDNTDHHYITELTRAYNRLMKNKQIVTGVILMSNYAIELIVAD